LTFTRVLTFGLLVITFVFLPNENWERWFVGDKGDYYAEFCLRDSRRCYVLTKNLLTVEVKLGFPAIQKGWSQKIGSDAIVELDAARAIPPESYSLVEVDPGSYDAEVLHRVGNNQALKPKVLVLVTPIEEQKWFVLIFALILTSAGLTYSIVSYVGEDDRQKADREAGCS